MHMRVLCLLFAPEWLSGVSYSVAHDERQIPPFWGANCGCPLVTRSSVASRNGYYSRYGKGPREIRSK